jgi:hypothetical protein
VTGDAVESSKVKPTWKYLRSWVEQLLAKFQFELLKGACPKCADEVRRSFSDLHLLKFKASQK